MKIIDLAERQRNNETLPKHIRYGNEDLYFDGVTYYDKEGNNDLFDILALNNNALIHLYDEVEILEEPKGIPEKIKLTNGGLTLHDNNNDYTLSVIHKCLINKINEIIDYLESKGDD